MANLLAEKLEKIFLQGELIQKYFNYHQNRLVQLKTQLSKPDADLKSLETSKIWNLSQIYQDVVTSLSQDFVELKYNFFPTNLNVAHSVKYAGGTSPTDLTLCHNSKFLLKSIRSNLRKKILANCLLHSTTVQERDCVIAVDMKHIVVRGVVMSVGLQQVVTLLDIDTGDFKMASMDNIYHLDEEAVSLHALCMRGSLEGDLADLNKYWTTDLSSYFVSVLKYGELMIEANCVTEDNSSFPPKYKVSLEVLVDDVSVMNVNRWVCDQLLPVLKKESENCLDLNKVIRGLPSPLLMPYLPTATDYTNLDNCSLMSSSQVISSPESSGRSSSSSDEFSVEIKIDPYSTPKFMPLSPSTPRSAPLQNQKEIDVFFTNTHMISHSSDSLEERRTSKCECGVDCVGLIGCGAPPELLLQNPKVPRITTVIPSLARIPNGEPFYYTMKNKSKSSLLPTPHNHRSAANNKSDPDIQGGDSFYNFYEQPKAPLLATPSLLPHPTSNHNGGPAGGSCPLIQRAPWSRAYQGILVPIRDVSSRLKWSNGVKHRSDNSLACAAALAPNYRRPLPKSHLYTNPLLPPYQEDSYDISGDTQFGVGAAYTEKSLGTGPTCRGEGISLKEQHYCQAEHLEKVSSVKLPGSVLMVEPGQERSALVTFTESPGKFYVNILEANTGHMEELEDALCEYYSTVSNLVSLVTIQEARYHLGEFVAAKWKTDNRWYRARVLDWNVCVKKSIAILYVDHGNMDLVPLDYIQPLMSNFAQYAPMAQACHLANVVPAGNSSSWNEEAIDMFSKFCNKNTHEVFSLTFQPSSSNDSSSSWSVILRNSAGECINELLLSAGLAAASKVNGHSSHSPVDRAPSTAPTESKGLVQS